MHTSKNHAENIVSSLMRFTRYAGRGRYCILAFLAATALASSSLSAAPVTVPGDLAPGFSYRLAFITSTATDATSTDINYYNTFVSNVAGGVPQLAALGTTWKAIGSTASIDARDNTGTNPASTGVPIYTLAGVRIANNNADLWDGEVHNIINLTELGTTWAHWPYPGPPSETASRRAGRHPGWGAPPARAGSARPQSAPCA